MVSPTPSWPLAARAPPRARATRPSGIFPRTRRPPTGRGARSDPRSAADDARTRSTTQTTARARHAGGRRRPRSDGRADRRRWPALMRERGVALRPHAKTHKSLEFARRQIAAGAAGLTVATIGEAEVFADGGVRGPVHRVPGHRPRAQGGSAAAAGRRAAGSSVGADSVTGIEALAARSRRGCGAGVGAAWSSSRSTSAARGPASGPTRRGSLARRADDSGSPVGGRVHPRRPRLRGRTRARRGRRATRSTA